jgi:hypothetical protein
MRDTAAKHVNMQRSAKSGKLCGRIKAADGMCNIFIRQYTEVNNCLPYLLQHGWQLPQSHRGLSNIHSVCLTVCSLSVCINET